MRGRRIDIATDRTIHSEVFHGRTEPTSRRGNSHPVGANEASNQLDLRPGGVETATVVFSMVTDIKRTAERIPLEVLNTGNFGLLDELLAPEFVDHTPQPGVAPTREGLKQSADGPPDRVPGHPLLDR